MNTEAAWNREVFDSSVVGIIGISATGTVHTFSHGAEQLFGYSAIDVIGRNVSMLMPPSYGVALERYLELLADTGEAQIIGSGRNLEARHANGSTFEVRLSIDRTMVDGVPMFIGIVVSSQGHEEARYWLDEFFDISLELLAVATFDGKFIRLNPSWESTLGYPLSELLSRPFMSFVHPEDEDSTAVVMGDLALGGQVNGFENRYLASDGTYHWLEWTAKPISDRGIIMAAARDISRRHMVEDQLRAARDEAKDASNSKSSFLSRMSHELRTPLNSVIGFAQLLDMDELTDEQHENVGVIQRSGRHLLNLIDEVLDIARIEEGKLRLSLEPVSVAEELSVALDLISPQAAERDLSIICVGGARDISVLADRQRLLQILLNLLSNAIKYNRHGGSISVEVEASGQTVSIAVTDTGIGINSSKLSLLFKPFERLGAEASAIEGTGVGLALSRTLSQQMNGALTVASTSGVGSTFCLELPQADSQETVREKLPGIDAGTAPVTGRKITVLYIEDNISNYQLMERALKTQGNIELIAAVQGSLGLELATRHLPDLILLDLHLPDISGEEVLQRVRATPAIADTVVVVCSADASPGKARRLIDDGANGYLTKPIDLNDLFEVVRSVRERDPLEKYGLDEY